MLLPEQEVDELGEILIEKCNEFYEGRYNRIPTEEETIAFMNGYVIAITDVTKCNQLIQ